jgi:tetratricopeptide (TPR) repeat protein
MEKSIHKLTLVFVLTAFFVSLASAQTPAPKGKPEKPLSAMSEGDLFKKGEADFMAGRLEDAREALTAGLAKKKKTDKKYSPMLDMVNAALADREADKGDAACRQSDLVTCEKQITAAKAFATSDKVTKLQTTFSTKLAEVKGLRDAALKMASSGDFEKSIRSLKDLTKYSVHLPTINADIEQTTKSFVQKLVSDGLKSMDEKRWEQASQEFQHVLDLDKNNATAVAGLKTIQRARSGYEQYAKAQAQATAKNYNEAIKLIDAAMATYPEAPEFEQFKNDTVRNSVAALAAPLEDMLTASDDLIKTRDTYLRVDQIRQIDAGNPVIAKYLKPASENFGAAALVKANELAEIVDYSRIATAYVMKLNAKLRLPEGTVQAEDLKSIAVGFNRKRVSQLLLSIDNLTTSNVNFVQTLQTRAKHAMESQQTLPDLKLRDLIEFQKDPKDDAQFQDLKPDGKSRNVQLILGVAKYESVRESGEPVTVRSKYINGVENVPNPEFRKKQEELSEIRRALDKPNQKKDKPTPEGWTEITYAAKKDELASIDKTLQQDRILDYGYTKTEYRQRTNIEVSLALKDYLSRTDLKTDRARYNPPEKVATEIEGVRDSDTNGLTSQRLRLTSTEADLHTGEDQVLNEIDKKLVEILPNYTYRFFNEGERALRQNDPDRAVEMYLCHWAFFRGHVPEAQEDKIVDFVKKQTGFDLRKEGGAFMEMLDLQ